MKTFLLLLLAPLLLTPGFALGQEAKPDSCESVDVKAPSEWIGSPTTRNVNIRIGPGIDYPLHGSGELFAGEEIQILQECQGWLQARSMPERLIDRVIERNGRRRAREMLLFWVRKDLIRRKGPQLMGRAVKQHTIHEPSVTN